MKVKSILAASLVLGPSVLFAAQATKDVPVVKLVDNAQMRFHTVVADDAPAPLRKGAAELVKYLDGGTPAPGEKTLPIEIRVEELPELIKDGFVLDVKPDGITITGWNARGALYGCYEILKKHAGMRWLVPGLNGEYRVGDWKNVSVPVGCRVCNPYIAQRTMSAFNSRLAAEWQARNNMAYVVWGVGCSRKYEGWMDDFAAEGVATGAHCMSALMLGTAPKGMSDKEWGEKCFKESPELFPLIDGKRVPMVHAHSPNPCVSNPKVLDRMAANLLEVLKRSPHSCDFPIILGNNDTTAWCECENCRAIDAPELRNTRGERADRYWYMVNGIAERVWKELPRANIAGWCYQDFWYPPARVRPNPKLGVQVSFNNQCWRHSCMDPNCAINREMVKIYAGWKKLGMPYVYNRDEIASGGCPGCEFEPSETVVAKNFLEYRDLGCNGSGYCLYQDDEPFFAWAKNGKFKGRNYHWQAMWQTQYIASLMMWDATIDWKAALEEANTLYYGEAAWKAGMKEFRALLTDCFLSTPGCIGWGQGATVGPCLDRPGSEEKLKALLDRAVYAAWRSGDGRAIRHVELEREIFQLTWLATRANYLLNHREITAYRAKDGIKVDGRLDEAAWKDSDTFSTFTTSSWSPNKENVQKTYVRVAYDADNLYFGVESMEPRPDKMTAGRGLSRRCADFGKLGNHVELFYSYPDMGEAAYHLSVNSNGEMIDLYDKSAAVQDDTFMTKATWKVSRSADRWTLEIAIPFSEIGQKVMPGATWKVNVARERMVEGAKAETSTMAGGAFFGTSCYVNVRFLENRQGTGERDYSAWKNGNFNHAEKNLTKEGKKRWADWQSEDVPSDWFCGAKGELLAKPDSPEDRFVRISSGHVGQFYIPQGKGKVRVSLKLRGKGKAEVMLLNYGDHPQGLKCYQPLSLPAQSTYPELKDDWQTVSLERATLGVKNEKLAVNVYARKDSVVDIDDVYVTPVE